MAKAKAPAIDTPEDQAARVALVASQPLRADGVDVAPGENFLATPANAAVLIASAAACFAE